MFEKILKKAKLAEPEKENGDQKKKNRKIENIIFLIILLIITVIVINNLWSDEEKKSQESTDKVLAEALESQTEYSQAETSRLL